MVRKGCDREARGSGRFIWVTIQERQSHAPSTKCKNTALRTHDIRGASSPPPTPSTKSPGISLSPERNSRSTTLKSMYQAISRPARNTSSLISPGILSNSVLSIRPSPPTKPPRKKLRLLFPPPISPSPSHHSHTTDTYLSPQTSFPHAKSLADG